MVSVMERLVMHMDSWHFSRQQETTSTYTEHGRLVHINAESLDN